MWPWTSVLISSFWKLRQPFLFTISAGALVPVGVLFDAQNFWISFFSNHPVALITNRLARKRHTQDRRCSCWRLRTSGLQRNLAIICMLEIISDLYYMPGCVTAQAPFVWTNKQDLRGKGANAFNWKLQSMGFSSVAKIFNFHANLSLISLLFFRNETLGNSTMY